jgi:hypothetical protein
MYYCEIDYVFHYPLKCDVEDVLKSPSVPYSRWILKDMVCCDYCINEMSPSVKYSCCAFRSNLCIYNTQDKVTDTIVGSSPYKKKSRNKGSFYMPKCSLVISHVTNGATPTFRRLYCLHDRDTCAKEPQVISDSKKAIFFVLAALHCIVRS